MEIAIPSILDRKASPKEIRAIIEPSRKYFEDSEVKCQIDIRADETLEWMRDNTQSFGPAGELNYNRPWWPETSYTESLALLETREQALPLRIYEHGMLYLLNSLATDGVIGSIEEHIHQEVTNPMTRIVINRLIAEKEALDCPDGVSLTRLSLMFGQDEQKKPTRLLPRVGRLMPIGILKVRYDQIYDVSIGTVAEAFFTRVYLPIKHETVINPEG